MNPRRKQSPNAEEELEDAIVTLRGAITTAEKLLSLKEHEGWQALKENLSVEQKVIEGFLDDYTKYQDRALIMVLATRKKIKEVIEQVDGAEAKREDLARQLSELQAKKAARG